MTVASVHITSDPDLAARFAREAAPLIDVLSRGARRLTRRDADAEDLLQDTLLHAYAGFRTFKEGTNLKAWLFRILYTGGSARTAASSGARRKFRSTTSLTGTWPVAPHAYQRGNAPPRQWS